MHLHAHADVVAQVDQLAHLAADRVVAGLAAHLWGLIFAALYGVIGWIALAIAERRRAD